MTVQPKPRVLLTITVYNGRAVVPAAIESATSVAQNACSIDVLVLDDCSPEPGWSHALQQLCTTAGVMYYRSPRNLGIPRNVNLGLLAALHGAYDYVLICNSDVLFPRDLVTQLVRVASRDGRIGSVTAWSNNVSVYSLPNEDPDRHLAYQKAVDWITRSLTEEFGDAAIDVPAGVSFCVLIPIEALRHVGLMDPVFGRGYCEETDWSLRSQAMGYRITLAPSVFVYHRGQASTVSAGLIPAGHTTVPAHEAIVAMRYPLFHSQVRNFLASDILPTAHRHALRRLIRAAAQEQGYTLQMAWLGAPDPTGAAVSVVVDPRSHAPELELRHRGFKLRHALNGMPVTAALRDLLGCDPSRVLVAGSGARTRAVVAELAGKGIPVREGVGYPERV